LVPLPSPKICDPSGASRPSPQRDASPLRVGWPPRVLCEQRPFCAYGVSAEPLCRWGGVFRGRMVPEIPPSTLRPSCRRPTYLNDLNDRSSPLSGFGSLSGFHRWTVANAGGAVSDPKIPDDLPPRLAPSRGFVPYRVFPVWGSAITKLHPRGSASFTVAPLGFRTLSTLCSPPDLPGLFHPGPASGVHPSRLCSTVSAAQDVSISPAPS
jgi:hypothetical protein